MAGVSNVMFAEKNIFWILPVQPNLTDNKFQIALQSIYIYIYIYIYISAARLVLQLPKRSHALERMQAELHWLVYPHRLYYKVGVISYKCLHGLAPPYLSTRLIKVSDVDGRSHLRSASDGQLVIPKSKTKTIGVRGFHISGPTFWNFLPGQLRDNDLTLRTFREQLKTVLFRDAVGKKALHALLRCW